MTFEENDKAIYIQIADRMCDAVLSGEYAPESRLPSVREVAAQAEVNANTVMRSYERLASMGVIYSKRGMGFYVAPDARAKVEEMRRSRLMGTQMEKIFSSLMHLGITPDDLKTAYEKFISERQ